MQIHSYLTFYTANGSSYSLLITPGLRVLTTTLTVRGTPARGSFHVLILIGHPHLVQEHLESPKPDRVAEL